MLRLDCNEEIKLDEQVSVIHLSTLTLSTPITKTPTIAYIDSLSENDRNRRDFSTVFNDQDNEFDSINLTNLDSITLVDRNPGSDNELANKNYVDDTIVEIKINRFNQTLQNYLKVSAGRNV